MSGEGVTGGQFDVATFRGIDYPGREFGINAFFTGHSVLLIRGPRHQGKSDVLLPKRVDVMFKAVKFMQLPTWMTGLRVTVADQDRVDEVETLMRGPVGSNVVFEVSGDDYAGTVVALGVYTLEDDEISSHTRSTLARDYDPRPDPTRSGDIAAR